MLRLAAQGGFMFSARKLVEAGGKVRSIMEYDLSSAYGFSVSHILMPSRFCTGFLCMGNGARRLCRCWKRLTRWKDTKHLNLKQFILCCKTWCHLGWTFKQFLAIFHHWVCFIWTFILLIWMSFLRMAKSRFINLTGIMLTAVTLVCRRRHTHLPMAKLMSRSASKLSSATKCLKIGHLQSTSTTTPAKTSCNILLCLIATPKAIQPGAYTKAFKRIRFCCSWFQLTRWWSGAVVATAESWHSKRGRNLWREKKTTLLLHA